MERTFLARRKKQKVEAIFDKRLSRVEKLLAHNTTEFLENSSLHGLQYLINRKLYSWEKVFFGVSFIIAVVVATYFILNVYDKWNRTPVIYSINPEASYVTNDPFPAVTICNLNQAYKIRLLSLSTEYAMLQMLCKLKVNSTVASLINDWSNLRKFIEDITQPCESMILLCRYGGVLLNCSKIFQTVVTDEGLCCTFNRVHPAYMFRNSSPIDFSKFSNDDFIPVDWSPQSGYSAERTSMFYPRKVAGTGETLGLSVILDVEADNYYCSSSNSIGFKILLHNPIERSSIREVGLLLAAGFETKVRVRSLKTESDLKLRSMNKNYRRCLFEDELRLKIFKKYTQRNCEVECVGALLLEHCGCVPHYMHPFVTNKTVCGIFDVSCMERIRINVALKNNQRFDCSARCWPSYFDLTYEPDFFTIKLEHKGFQIRNEMLKNLSNEYVERNIAIVNFYHMERLYRSNKQSDFIRGSDFLASAGGLIGLFFGFSFISVVEIIFYTFIHPWRGPRQSDNKNPIPEVGSPQKKLKITNSPAMGQMRRRFKSRFDLRGHYADSGLLANPTYLNKELLQSVTESLEKRNLRNSYIDKWYAQNQYMP